MEIYTDKEIQKAILVCNAEELADIEHALFSKYRMWLEQANIEQESWQADLDLKIAREIMELYKQISNKLDESEAGKFKII